MNGNGENIVCVIYPERQPEIAMLDECEKLIRGFGMHIRTWNIPGCSGYGLMYDDRKIFESWERTVPYWSGDYVCR